MIDVIKLQDKINQIVAGAYPGFKIYRDKLPQGFERPSFLISYVASTSEVVNKDIVSEKASYKVTYFSPVEAPYHQEEVGLQTVLTQILKAFRQGYVRVEDRAIKVKVSSTGNKDDETYIDIQFEYYEDRIEESDSYPLMQEATIKIKEGY